MKNKKSGKTSWWGCVKEKDRQPLIVFGLNLEVCLRMIADRADLRRFFADMDMTAVAALPDHNAGACKNLFGFNIFEQGAVTLLVLLFNLSNRLEEVRDPVEPFLFGFLRKFCVHVGPLEVFAGSGIRKVDSGGRYTVVQQLKPDLRMFPLVAGGLQEKVRNLYKPFLLCLGGIIGVFVGKLLERRCK